MTNDSFDRPRGRALRRLYWVGVCCSDLGSVRSRGCVPVTDRAHPTARLTACVLQ